MTQVPPFVVKIGGEVVQSPAMGALAHDVAELARGGVPVLVVHGGGPQSTQLQKALGQTPRIVGGQRVTDAAALDVIKMAVAGRVNVDACAALVAAGAKPVGLHGASSLVVHARRRSPLRVGTGDEGVVDLGLVGDVVGVNWMLLQLLLSNGYVPVVACLGADEAGAVYNINADSVAHHLAVRLGARALALVTDVPGVLRDVADPTSRIATLRAPEARRALEEGVITRGMIPKVEEAFLAIDQGVHAVYILGNLGIGELAKALREPGSVGTVLSA